MNKSNSMLLSSYLTSPLQVGWHQAEYQNKAWLHFNHRHGRVSFSLFIIFRVAEREPAYEVMNINVVRSKYIIFSKGFFFCEVVVLHSLIHQMHMANGST